MAAEKLGGNEARYPQTGSKRGHPLHSFGNNLPHQPHFLIEH